MIIKIEDTSKNRIRIILVLFLFGFMMNASGLCLVLQVFTSDGLVGSFIAVVGVLCIVLDIHLVRNWWW